MPVVRTCADQNAIPLSRPFPLRAFFFPSSLHSFSPIFINVLIPLPLRSPLPSSPFLRLAVLFTDRPFFIPCPHVSLPIPFRPVPLSRRSLSSHCHRRRALVHAEVNQPFYAPPPTHLGTAKQPHVNCAMRIGRLWTRAENSMDKFGLARARRRRSSAAEISSTGSSRIYSGPTATHILRVRGRRVYALEYARENVSNVPGARNRIAQCDIFAHVSVVRRPFLRYIHACISSLLSLFFCRRLNPLGDGGCVGNRGVRRLDIRISQVIHDLRARTCHSWTLNLFAGYTPCPDFVLIGQLGIS